MNWRHSHDRVPTNVARSFSLLSRAHVDVRASRPVQKAACKVANRTAAEELFLSPGYARMLERCAGCGHTRAEHELEAPYCLMTVIRNEHIEFCGCSKFIEAASAATRRRFSWGWFAIVGALSYLLAQVVTALWRAGVLR